jgi:outer membrane protein assembly factor BamB
LNPLEADDPRVIGDFRLQSRLGAGGMGRVYLGFSPAGRAVAVKVIHPHLARDPAFSARFRREVSAAQAVNAVYAAPVVAAGPDDDPPWLATAFVPAPSLQDVVATAGPLPEEAVWKLAAGLAEALRAVHASGLVHRDMKPGNVLVATDGPRLIDFGIARVLDGTRLTATDSVMGTPSYMSPEQAQGTGVDPPSDVFSLGGVVCFAATGQPPFGGGIPATLLYRIVFNEPELDHLPPQLRSLVAACLDKNPAARPTPAQLATALMPSMPSMSTAGRLAFWPEPVARFIQDYQARLDADGAQGPLAPQAPFSSQAPVALQGPASTWQDPAGGSTPGWQPGRETTVRQPGGRHAQGAGPGEGLSRRRALAALAGAAAAGLGIAGWEVSKHVGSGDGTKKLTADQTSLKSVPPGTKVWRSPAANAAVQSIAPAGQVVYAGTGSNAIFALDANTGKRLWRRTTTSQINGRLAVSGNSIVVAGDDGPFGLSAKDGSQLWHLTQDTETPLVAAGNVAYAGFPSKSNTTGGVTALDPATGTVLWSFEFGPTSDVTGAIAVADGVVYTTSSDGEIFTLTAANGTKRRRITGSFGEFGAGTLAVVSGVVFAGGDAGKGSVFAVNAATGNTLWRTDLGKSSFPAYLASTDGVVFAGLLRSLQASGQDGDGLYALNAATGKQLWSVPVSGGVNAGPVAASGVVYTGSEDGVLDAWQATTGNKLWSYTAPDPIGSLVVVAGRVYFGAGDYVYSFGA